MTEPLIFDNLGYISIVDAAASANLSTSYLARLVRSDRLTGRRVGRMWFIELHSLQHFLSVRSENIGRTKPGPLCN